MNWDDLRYILSVYDHGSALAAAQKLGVNASTVQRRVGKFEETNNIRLFERLQSGYHPTPECEGLVKVSRDIDENVARLGREILNRDLRLEGRLMVTSTDTFINNALAPHLASFNKLHPNITIELTVTNSRLNLSRQDADIAIRPSANPQESLVGQHVANLGFGIYASRELASQIIENPRLEDLKTKRWLGVGERLSGAPGYKWVHQHIPQESCWLTLDAYTAMADCAAQSLGLAVLPCIVADTNPKLQRIHCPWLDISTSVWVLTHPEIKNAARVRAFMEHITKALRNDRPKLAGHYSEEEKRPMAE